ncbi:hypothetical protein EJ05DRAFT_310796 [Pseudovirgaria hyperparasitica]|uniref:Dystroglycan-type cadherin-like domain-containing protein n=1 Tax=Pseudovirgaria hyperparasitica TaxID=470096 RepID=A0A6A6WB72_9PEZI|nr:uncharacterized protein EJ05DRAFT_310796 [Pseudovirgaria hyperparasitica]KAF2759815.1 hypothetical protein EJ05DRAFT_310796 [Pseudovirgaria hyperparasitica]
MLIIFLFAFLAAASAVPYVSLPFNSQYPPVGRAGQVYSYELSPHTFGPLPDAADFQLALDNGPSWLSLNSTSLVLEGKPAEEDVGSSSFSIVASKGANQVTMNCSLRVVDYRGPDVKGDLVDVMVEGNDRTGSTTVLIAPDSAVLVELADDTFGSEWNNLSYAATNDDGLPLPSWLNFNPDNLTFSGQAPRLENASQLFDIRVVASDMDGFASAELPFTFVLSEHKLAFSPVSPNITLKTGDAVHFDSIGSMLQLDGKQVEVDQTSSLSAHGLPDWLEYDSKTGSLDGNSPDGVESLAFSVEASDKYDGYVNTTFTLTFVPSLFTGAIQTLDATPGTAFSYTFPDSLFAAQGLNIALQTTRTTAWLAYSPANKIMYGDVPLDMATGDIEVTLVATSPQHPSTTERRIIKIHLTQAKTKDAMLHKKRIIMVICLMSVLAITILIGMRVLYIRARRRRRSRKTDPKTISHGNHPSNPYTIGTDPDTDDDDDDPEQGSAVEKSEKQHAPSNPSPPCLELSEAPPTKSHAQQPKPTNPSSTPLTPFGRDTLFVLTEAYGRLSARDGICATERAIKRAASSPESHKNDNNNNDKISKAKPKPKPRKSSSSPPSRTPSSIKRKGEVAAAALRRKWSNASGVSRSSYSSSALSAKLSEFPTPPLPSLPSLPSLVTAGSVGMGRDGVVSRVDRVVAEGEMANSTTTKQKQKQNQKRPRPTSTLSMFPPPSSSTPKTGLKIQIRAANAGPYTQSDTKTKTERKSKRTTWQD